MMEVEDFANKEKEELHMFVNYWLKNRIKNKNDFPQEMNLPDWEEQFLFFKENKSKTNEGEKQKLFFKENKSKTNEGEKNGKRK